MGNQHSEDTAKNNLYRWIALYKVKRKPNAYLMFKLISIGDSRVGKTSLMWRYKQNMFPFNQKCNIRADFVTKEVEVGGRHIELYLWDTCGAERFRAVGSTYYRGSHGLMLVFDLTNMESLHNTKSWLEEAMEYCHDDVTKILVGNKSDLTEKRAVTYELAQQIADQFEAEYFETSAKTGENVSEAFTAIVSDILQRVDNDTLPMEEVNQIYRNSSDDDQEGSGCSCG